MRKIRCVIILLMLAFCFSGCEKKDEQIVFDVNKEQLENDGYSDVGDILYAKIDRDEENIIVYMNCYKNQPQMAMYAVSGFMTQLDYECEFVIQWNGIEYRTEEWNDAESKEEAIKLLPPEWQEVAKELNDTGIGIGNMISAQSGKDIDKDIERIVSDYKDNEEKLEYETNTEVAEDDSDEDIVICESESLIDNEKFIATLHERNGEYDICVVGLAKNEEKATIMLASCNEQLEKLYDERFCKSYSVGVYCNDKIAMITVNDYGENASGFNSDGSAVSGDLPDWIVSDITMPENECNAYNDEILKALSDFCKEMQTSLK